MSQKLFANGTVEITIPVNESVAVYTKGTATVYQIVGYPNVPSTKDFVETVSNAQSVIGSYSVESTLVIEAGASDVLYSIGIAPVVSELYASQIQIAPVAVDTTGAVSATAMLGGIVTSAAATVAGTVPTGTNMDLASEFAIGDSFDWSVIKVGANDFTVTAATGHTLVGVAVVTTATSALFRTRKTAANTFVTYRIG